MDKVAVADALERAADLYEAEQVNWCKFKWIDREVVMDPNLDMWRRTGRMSVCAEGAILMAVGFNDEWISKFGSGTTRRVGIKDRHDVPYQIYTAAVVAVEERLPVTESLTGWNDTADIGKAEVIELFKATAKDLRNG